MSAMKRQRRDAAGEEKRDYSQSLGDDAESHISDYLRLPELGRLRQTQSRARSRRYGAATTKVRVPQLPRTIPQNFWQTFRWSVVRDIDAFHSDLRDEDLVMIAQKCPNLTSLDVTDCRNLQAEFGILAVARQCTRLETLELDECRHVSDATLLALAENCPRLRNFALYGNVKVTDVGMATLASKCSLLHTVRLTEVDKIGDDTLKALAQNCPNVTIVDVDRCENVGDEGIVALAESCRDLQNLCFIDANNCTVKSVHAIARNCNKVTHLHVADDSCLSLRSLEALANGCPLLQELHTVGTDVEEFYAFLHRVQNIEEMFQNRLRQTLEIKYLSRNTGESFFYKIVIYVVDLISTETEEFDNEAFGNLPIPPMAQPYDVFLSSDEDLDDVSDEDIDEIGEVQSLSTPLRF